MSLCAHKVGKPTVLAYSNWRVVDVGGRVQVEINNFVRRSGLPILLWPCGLVGDLTNDPPGYGTAALRRDEAHSRRRVSAQKTARGGVALCGAREGATAPVELLTVVIGLSLIHI